jgi:hypothetical protein
MVLVILIKAPESDLEVYPSFPGNQGLDEKPLVDFTPLSVDAEGFISVLHFINHFVTCETMERLITHVIYNSSSVVLLVLA